MMASKSPTGKENYRSIIEYKWPWSDQQNPNLLTTKDVMTEMGVVYRKVKNGLLDPTTGNQLVLMLQRLLKGMHSERGLEIEAERNRLLGNGAAIVGFMGIRIIPPQEDRSPLVTVEPPKANGAGGDNG